MSFIIQAENVHYKYEDGYHALRGINLKINAGERIAVMGANGSGKSTFFLCLNGIRRPSKGQLYFDGCPIDYSRKGLLKLRRQVGIVIQDPDHQMFCADVTQEISFGPMNLGIPVDTVRKDVNDIMKQLQITPFSKKPTHALSGGQKKQVSIADILVMHPRVILLDEPTASLDPRHSEIVNYHINQCTNNNITVIQSTHDVDYACQWADQIILFHDGQVLKTGSPEEIFTDIETLNITNLKQPAHFKLFLQLQQKELLPDSLPLPRSTRQLETYIEKYL